jgi:cysteine desulfurase
MKKVYLDNASTTQIRLEVVDEISKVMIENFGNPSSSHSFGRNSKNLLELSRKSIAKNLNVSSQEIIFTSGGTEANNWIIKSAVRDLNVKRIISSKIEHHAVLNVIEVVKEEHNIEVEYVNLLPNGNIDLTHLVELLTNKIPTLVSLMHVNNETGIILDLERVGVICKEHDAFFHSDCVQSIGKERIDLQILQIDFLVASAHKFHGPKGIGFAFIKKNILLNPIIFGGDQEKGQRAGTESLHNIVGMSKALDIATNNLAIEKEFILKLKNYCVAQLLLNFPDVYIIGENTFYNILNIVLPFSAEKSGLILFNLDMKGIAVSRGSACQSGSSKPSHVLAEILPIQYTNKPNIRISFSHFNSFDDVDYLIKVLKEI